MGFLFITFRIFFAFSTSKGSIGVPPKTLSTCSNAPDVRLGINMYYNTDQISYFYEPLSKENLYAIIGDRLGLSFLSHSVKMDTPFWTVLLAIPYLYLYLEQVHAHQIYSTQHLILHNPPGVKSLDLHPPIGYHLEKSVRKKHNPLYHDRKQWMTRG